MAKFFDHPVDESFNEHYLNVREKEDRFFTIDEIKKLPETRQDHPHLAEWKLRAASFQRFSKYFATGKFNTVLDLACGNGWFINRLLQLKPNCQLTGVEINKMEIAQAKELFTNNNNVSLVLGDVFDMKPEPSFDMITVLAAIQYFQPLKNILDHLIELLNEGGELHLIDSPFYNTPSEAKLAAKRSKAYFEKMSVPEMSDYYFHHSFEELGSYNYRLMYDPNTRSNKLKRKLKLLVSPFPWLCIQK